MEAAAAKSPERLGRKSLLLNRVSALDVPLRLSLRRSVRLALQPAETPSDAAALLDEAFGTETG
jgi:hypothetical protein